MTNKRLIILPVVLLLLFSILAFSIPNFTAFADSVNRDNTKPLFHPLGNCSITFHALNDNQVSYVHDYPSAIGGYVESSPNQEATATHSYKNNSGAAYPTAFTTHNIYDNGGERIGFSPSRITSVKKPLMTYNIGFTLNGELPSLLSYQWDCAKNIYSFDIRARFVSFDGSHTRDYSYHTLLVSDNFSDKQYPEIPNTSTSFASINIASLLYRACEQQDDLVLYNTKFGGYNLQNMTINVINDFDVLTSTNATIYARLNRDLCRDFNSTRPLYESYYVDAPILSIFTPLHTFLSLEFFPNFTFGYLLLIVIGFSFIALLIKVLSNA